MRSDGQTLGVGAGQMSRVDAARFGAMKAVLPLKGCVAASDAFFPFPDGLETVAEAGATAVIQPGGSVKDQDVIAAADAWAGHGLHRHPPLPALSRGPIHAATRRDLDAKPFAVEIALYGLPSEVEAGRPSSVQILRKILASRLFCD